MSFILNIQSGVAMAANHNIERAERTELSLRNNHPIPKRDCGHVAGVRVVLNDFEFHSLHSNVTQAERWSGALTPATDTDYLFSHKTSSGYSSKLRGNVQQQGLGRGSILLVSD